MAELALVNNVEDLLPYVNAYGIREGYCECDKEELLLTPVERCLSLKSSLLLFGKNMVLACAINTSCTSTITYSSTSKKICQSSTRIINERKRER